MRRAFHMRAAVGPWIDAALNLFFPPICQLCRNSRATASQGYVCETCRRQADFIVPPFCDKCGLPFEGSISERFQCSHCRDLNFHFSRARSAVAAKGAVLEAIHRYKYQRALFLEPFLVDCLTQV